MFVAIGIVAHTTRMAQAKELARTVKADFISIDDGTLGADGNHIATQQHLAGIPSTWSAILEDDAVPIPDFRNQLKQALLMAPSPIVSTYLGKQRPPQWQKRIRSALLKANEVDASWLLSTHMLHAVGYAVKTDLLPSLNNHISSAPSDERVSAWARSYGHLISYTSKSLVDHLDGPTIVEHRDGKPRPPGRTAWATGPRTHWTTKAVTL